LCATSKLVRRIPAFHPRLDIIKRNSVTGGVESIEPPPVLGDFRTSQIDDGAKQCDRLGKNGRDVLPTLSGKFREPCVRSGIDFKRSANHKTKIVARSQPVE
jgi:hypothetical protein